MDDTRRIASAILARAVRDWRNHGHITEKPDYSNWSGYLAWLKAQDLGYKTPRDELMAFFESDWFDLLCWAAGRDADVMRGKIGLESDPD